MYGRNSQENLHIRALAQPVDLPGLHRMAPQRYPFLLQSTAPGPALGRFDILFAFPGEAIELGADGKTRGRHDVGGFLATLDAWWKRESCRPDPSALPYTGGWFLFLGYELAQEIEPSLDLQPDPVLPAAFAVRCPAAIIYDHVDRQAYWVVEAGARIDHALFISDLEEVTNSVQHLTAPASPVNATEETPAEFLHAIGQAKRYIVAGDIYQTNLSRSWTARVDDEVLPEQIYRSLCAANPAPFAGIVRWNGTTVISSSPERLLEIRGSSVSTRPIAGTRPRSDNTDIDDSLSRELFANAKERAEHVMLIDLERNDLGRICEPGTVAVDECMVLESYAHVHHIVSNVRGQLRADVTPGDAIAAVFPGGTITGCPKVRCMQIIDELETAPRGAYTGSFGYLNRDGSLDLNILIRTMVMRDGTITLRAGCGIVADSEPDAELAETRAKAAGMLRALRK